MSPYGDLEVYSDNPQDLSVMDSEAFLDAYRKIIKLSVDRLKPNRFAAFVVGNYRRKDGTLFDFTAETTRAFEDAGCSLYNQFVLITHVNTLSLRVGRQFVSSRKAGMRHQTVVVCVKGDPKIATKEIGPVDPIYPGGVFDSSDSTNVLDLFGE